MTTERKGSISAADFREAYKEYCRELDKEDTLINNRVNWLLTSQSILFAALGLSGKDAGLIGAIVVRVLPGLGFALCVAIWVSILAAISTFLEYRRLLKTSYRDAHVHDLTCPQLARTPRNVHTGFVGAVAAPLIFCAAWILVYCYTRGILTLC